jgi:hypothetical protein
LSDTGERGDSCTLNFFDDRRQFTRPLISALLKHRQRGAVSEPAQCPRAMWSPELHAATGTVPPGASRQPRAALYARLFGAPSAVP